MFLQGIVTTLIITILSIILGTALGFGTFLLCRKGNRVANEIARFSIWLIEGMPVVVLLMILYYIIFSEAKISGVVVSVIAFTLIFTTAVFSMLKAGVSTVDTGQMEAVYSLGYTDRKAFFKIILPQALLHVMPSYKTQIKSLIKATAVVGYVAVQDLTKIFGGGTRMYYVLKDGIKLKKAAGQSKMRGLSVFHILSGRLSRSGSAFQWQPAWHGRL